MAKSRKFALKPDPRLIVRAGSNGVKRCPALWICVVVIVGVVAGAALIIPAGGRVYQPRSVQLFDSLSDPNFRERLCA